MVNSKLNRLCPLLSICAALALTACGSINTAPAGPEEHESRSVDLDKSEKVRAELNMGSGELDVRGGAAKLLDAGFTYNVAAWKPDLTYSAAAGLGDLVLKQPNTNSSTMNGKNHWDLSFNDTVPLDLRVEFGAGESRFNLGSLSLRGLNIQMGAGKMRLDLRGTPATGYSANIQGGVGEATIYVPASAGISAKITGGLGEISVTGLHKDGDLYVNDTSQTAKVKIRLDIQGGIGSIKLISE